MNQGKEEGLGEFILMPVNSSLVITSISNPANKHRFICIPQQPYLRMQQAFKHEVGSSAPGLFAASGTQVPGNMKVIVHKLK